MDLINYKSNPNYDSLINQIINNELNHDQVMKSILGNEFANEPSLENQSEYFVNYFINSLHLSSAWIINSSNSNPVRSIQNTPIKLIPIPIKKTPNDKLDVKRNLFDSKSDSKSDSRFSSPKFDTSKFEVRFDSIKQHRQNEAKVENLNLNDDESFPKLNNHTFVKTTPTSTERKSAASDQKSSKKQRRINPTLVNDTIENNANFVEIKDKKNLRKTLFEKNRKIFDEAPELEQKNPPRDEIKLMAKDISMLTPKKSSTTTANNIQLLVRTPIKNQEQAPAIQPSLDRVNVDKVKFDNLVLFYSNLIKHNLIPNVLAELDFLIQLVTRRCANEHSNEFLAAFQFCSNYHNCIYFTIKSLEYVYEHTLVNYFDEQFFKTLSLNESIKRMSPAFHSQLLNCEQLMNVDEQIHDLSTAIVPAFDFIAYQPETDSQENFPNDHSFHLFRRQRDAFFKLYYDWKQLFTKKLFKQDSILNDQEFKFIHKVTFIFSLSKDFANYFHLARLFLAQLMQCCTGQNATNAEQTISELIKQKATTNQSTPNVCENKMKKLNKRFNQQDQKVMATQSSFTGEEIFFYEFITACNNYSFLTILQRLLISKIAELNDPNLLVEAIELDENNLEIASFFCTNLLNLQLLAKFLGLIVFMPFYSKVNSTVSPLAIANKNSQFNEIVKNIHPEETSLCKMINQMIVSSLKRKHLISTIPWIIQFLNQMDSNATTLTNYDPTFNLLVDIYHELGSKIDQYQMDKMNYAYLKLVFGNFFEKYFFVCHVKLYEISRTELLAVVSDLDKTLDSFQLINKKFLNACFPKLFVIKELVKQGIATQNNEIRKIKPLSLNESSFTTAPTTANTPAKLDRKNLVQIEFEENFFRLHADSLRKTVEFVADRLHSKCIKSLRIDVIKKVKRETFAKYSDLSKTTTILGEIRQECLKFIEEFANRKVNETIDLLVSEHDFSQSTIKIAIEIASRMFQDKCSNWMSNNVNDSWIINETLVENGRRLQQSKPITPAGQLSNQLVPSISYCFNHIRDHICDLLFQKETNCTKDELNRLIDELRMFRNPNSHLNARTNQVIETTMMDLTITLVTYQPNVVDSDLIQKIVLFYVDNKLTINKFISARNLLILSQSKERLKTWDKYESILLRLIQKDVYSIQSLETDVLGVLDNQNEWNEQLLTKLASCIKTAVDFCKSNEKYKDYAEKIELIDWLSWFCGQSNDF